MPPIITTSKMSPFIVGAVNQERATVTQPASQRQADHLPTNGHISWGVLPK